MGLRLGTKYGTSLSVDKQIGDSDTIASIETAGFSDLNGQIASPYYIDKDEANEIVAELLSLIAEESDEGFDDELQSILYSAGLSGIETQGINENSSTGHQ